MPDKTIVCKDCGGEFVFTEGEQEFYKEKDSKMILLDAQSVEKRENRKNIDNKFKRQPYFNNMAVF